jgi:hypothetical protein
VAEWENPSVPGAHIFTGQLRGLTAIPDPNGGTHQVLAMHWDSPDCKIHLVDPLDNHKATQELDTRQFVRNAWGNTAGVITVGYNDWLAATHPDTGEKVHLIGAWANYLGGELGSAEGKSSRFLVRDADAAYSLVRIWDPANPLTGAAYGLRGCRSIRPSPFPSEAGRAWYFCGFDLTGIGGGANVTGSHGWIYKGVLCALPGDIDGNGRITVMDLLGILLIVTGTLESDVFPWAYPECADLSGDGVIDIHDVLLLSDRLSEHTGMSP